MAELIETQDSQIDRLTLAAASVPYTSAKVHLTKVEMDIQPDTPLADLITNQADYSGYAPQTVTWHNPTVSEDGQVECVCTALLFSPTDALNPNNIYAVFLTDAASGELLQAGALDGAPIPLEGTLSTLRLNLRLRQAGASLSVVIA